MSLVAAAGGMVADGHWVVDDGGDADFASIHAPVDAMKRGAGRMPENGGGEHATHADQWYGINLTITKFLSTHGIL